MVSPPKENKTKHKKDLACGVCFPRVVSPNRINPFRYLRAFRPSLLDSSIGPRSPSSSIYPQPLPITLLLYFDLLWHPCTYMVVLYLCDVTRIATEASHQRRAVLLRSLTDCCAMLPSNVVALLGAGAYTGRRREEEEKERRKAKARPQARAFKLFDRSGPNTGRLGQFWTEHTAWGIRHSCSRLCRYAV